MKNIFLGILALLLVTPIVAAQNNGIGAQSETGSQQVVTSINNAAQDDGDTSTGRQVENQIQMQNQGEDSQLQISTEERTVSESSNSMDMRSEKAIGHMSDVATQVQNMLQIRTSGGIGDQVRVVAREQNQAQEQIQQQMKKMTTKNKMLKKLFGPDYGAIASLQQLIEDNMVRIEQMQTLLAQVQNYADRAQIEQTIQSIVSQNVALNELILEESRQGSIFGWLVRLLYR